MKCYKDVCFNLQEDVAGDDLMREGCVDVKLRCEGCMGEKDVCKSYARKRGLQC